jgi:DNA-binding FrmR family transcriptional regulator
MAPRGAQPLPDTGPGVPSGCAKGSGPTPPGVPWLRSEPEGATIALDPKDMGKVINRLKRAQGQLAGVVRMLDEGRDCEDIVTQLSALSRALDRAGFAIIATGMRQCLVESDGARTLNVHRLEKIFLSLA